MKQMNETSLIQSLRQLALILLLLGGASLGLAACDTSDDPVEEAGESMEDAAEETGEAMEDAAEEVEGEIDENT